MSPFDQIRSIIANPTTNPDDETPAEVRRLLIRAARKAHPAAAERVSTEIDAFNEDFALLVVSAAIAGSEPLGELRDQLLDRLQLIGQLVEGDTTRLH